MIYIILMVAAFFILLIFRIPIPFALLISTLIYFFGAGIPLDVVIVKTFRAFDDFVLLSIPFFILAGHIMTESGISDRLVKLSDLLVGKVKGHLAYVNIVVSMFFGGITGTAISDTTAIGSILIPSMKKEGYTSEFSAAVTAASSTMGPIIPPSLMFIIYGSLAQVSIRDLFLAGAVPGVMIGFLQMGVVGLLGLRHKFPKRKYVIQRKEALKTIKDSVLALLLPVIILGGILSGIFSPTEAAVVAAIYAIILSLFVYRTINWKKMLIIIKNAAIETGSVSIIIAAAALFGWALSHELVPQRFAEMLTTHISAKWQVLLLMNVMLAVLGMFMDSIPAIMIVTPVFIPLLNALNVSPLHAGIFMCVNLITGLSTPPVGCCLFAASVISESPMEKISRAIVPFLIANFTVVLLITYVPKIVLFIPALFK
jgi:tripartite ATP-independent transporter DctM subunit